MFGDLFAEEDDEESAITVTSRQKNIFHSSSKLAKKVVQEPAGVRGATGLCGLINQGGTCYLNSLIQTLFFTPELRECFFQLGAEDLGEKSEEDFEHSKSKVRVIPLELQYLFAQMLFLNQDSVSTSNLTGSFGWTGNQGFQQHDVQELNRILFSAIESSLVGTSGQDLIRDLYYGTSVSKITCQDCGKVSEREEEFLDLQMVLMGCSSLTQSLEMSYVMPEIMEGSNQYMCDSCKKLVNATRGAKLRSLPSILTFSLVRFTYDLRVFERYKETQRYTFPLELDMRQYCEVKRDDDVYELFSVVIHKGSCHGGHYHAYIHDIEHLGRWAAPAPDKESTGGAGPKEDVNINVNDYPDPVQLIQVLVTKLGGRTSVSDLCQWMSKKGVSWNHKYKKQYGPMTKFIKKHSDVFEMVDRTMVALKCEESRDKESKHNSSQTDAPFCSGEQSPAAEMKRSHPLSKSANANEPDDVNDASANKSFSDHWFDLNDTKISCISEQDIKKQFAGKESAYMLFYRRKGLRKSDKTINSFSLPSKLISKISSENAELQRQRDEYDKEINRITVLLNFVCDFTVKDGVIVPKEGISTDPAVLTLDRRKTVAEFLAHVNEWYFHDDSASCEWIVHTADRLPAGLHLYQDITTCKTASLMDLHVDDGCELFIWNGKQVDGHIVRTGSSCEPVLLCVTYPDKGTNTLEIQKPFPKDSTLGELKVAISTLSGIKPSKLILSIMKSSKRSKTKVEELLSSQDGSTLKDLDFQDGQRLVVDKKAKQKKSSTPPLCLAKTEAEKYDNEMNIIVENRCTTIYQDSEPVEDERPAWPRISMNVKKHKSISELKYQIAASPDFQITPDQSFVVRVEDPAFGLGPPLYDHQRIEEVVLDSKHTVVIEPGTPIAVNQITVRFYCTASQSRVEQEIILDKTTTIQNCLRLIAEQADLEGSNWHLCKTNWYGEVADVIENEEATLEYELVKNGELLVVESGRLPPKGFIRLSLYLFKHPRVPLQENNGVLSWITAGLQDLLGVSSTNNSEDQTEELVPLGELEISQENTLVDLKIKINTLLQREKLEVYSPACLRIQAIKHGSAGRVLRDKIKPLRFLKLNSSSKLSVQILAKEEDLSPSAILLNLRKRLPGKRLYESQQQVIFDPEDGATPASLRQFISHMYHIPVERVAMAKYIRHRYDWTVISDKMPSKMKNKKNKVNLRHSPYHLQDGDVIGVKDASLNTTLEDEDDFSTSEDDAAKERLLRLEEEEKIQRRRDERSKRSNRRPELELKIHVEDYTKQ